VGKEMNLLEKAQQAPEPSTYSKTHKWIKLVPVVKVLREKRYTYKEISKWLTEEGVKCTHSDIAQVYQRYIKGK
jgi:hypothetical protein